MKVSPTKGTLRFGQKGRLSRRYTYDIVSKIGDVAYRLALPPELSSVYNVFYMSMLKKYVPDPLHVLRHELLEIREDATYVENLFRLLIQRKKS